MLKRNSSDSVSALFTQLKNGILAKRKTICVPQTNLNWTLASLLVRENFISGEKIRKSTFQFKISVYMIHRT